MKKPRVFAYVSEQSHRQLKLLCVLEHVSMSKRVEELIEKEVRSKELIYGSLLIDREELEEGGD